MFASRNVHSCWNELREANNEEFVGERKNYGDDALDLEEGFTNSLLERQSEVYGITVFGEDSWRIPSGNPIDWTPPSVKTNLGEPEFDIVNNPGQCSEFTFCRVFSKGGGIYKIHALPVLFIPLPQDSSGTRLIN